MKKRITFFHVLKLFLLSAAIFLTTSCENFLNNGQSVKNEIEDAIAYNNAAAGNLLFSSDAEYGKFLTGNEKSCKIGYTVEVQFWVNSENCVFQELEAVGSDKTSRAEYVQFTDITTEDEKNNDVYRIRIKLLKQPSDIIMIQPVCLKFPAVETVFPELNTDGVNSNNPVVITFNMPMEDASVTPVNSNFNFQNISLIYTNQAKNNTDMSVYFEPPYFDEEKKNLTFIPKALLLQKFITSLNRETIDIKFSFNEKISVTKDGIVLPLKQDQKSNCTIRYKAAIEKTKPVKGQDALFFATKDDISIQNAAGFSQDKKIPVGQFDDSHFTDAEVVYAHRVGSTIHIYGEYTDEDSGVKTVFIKERLMNDKDGTDVSSTTQFQTYTYDLTTNENVQSVFDDAGNVKFCITHQLHGDDGLMLLKVSAADACQNESDETVVTVVHDTEFNIEKVAPYNAKGAYANPLAGFSNFDISGYSEGLKTIRLFSEKKTNYAYESVISKRIYKDYELESQKLLLKCCYSSASGMKEKEFIYNSALSEWDCTLDVESVGGLKFDISIYDDLGNGFTKNYQIPDVPFLIKADSNYKYFGTYDNDNTLCWVGEDGVGASTGYNFVYQNKKCYVYIQNFSLFSPLSKLYDENAELPVDDSLPVVNFAIDKPVVLEPLDSSYQITVKIDENAWDTYDRIAIKHNNPSYYVTSYSTLDKGCCELTFKEATSYLWNNVTEIEVWGVTENARSAGNTISCPEKPFKDMGIDRYSYDNNSPTISSFEHDMNLVYAAYLPGGRFPDASKYNDFIRLIRASDNESGIRTFKWTINDSDKVYSGAEGTGTITYRVKDLRNDYDSVTSGSYIPVWDMDEDHVTINVTVTDINNNATSKTEEIDFIEVPQFYIYHTEDENGNLTERYLEAEWYGQEMNLWRVGVFSLDQTGNWVLCADASKNMSQTDFSAKPTKDEEYYKFSNITLPPDSYIKVVTMAAPGRYPHTTNFGVSDPTYYYTGTPSSALSGNSSSDSSTDYILMGENGALIASDQPVLVETWSTKKSYEECKDWDYYTWIHRHKHSGTKLLSFAPGDCYPKKYDLPKDLAEGDCYVIIVHFATEYTQGVVSKVMVK